MPEIVYLDFETEAIGPRPKEYPPKPVGVALLQNGASKYFAWGHTIENTCSYAEGLAALKKVWDSDAEIVCHNAPFDISVACEKMGLPELPWHRVHCTQIMAFLVDPHAKSLALKDLAEERCGMPPAERDAVRDWILKNVKGSTKAKFGIHISKAPGKLVGEYAETDVFMTKALFELFAPIISDSGMQEAYDRERKLMPILMENSRLGIPVDVEGLEKDIAIYAKVLEDLDIWIKDRLGVGATFNIDSDDQLAEVLEASGLISEWVYTDKGAKSMSGEALDKGLRDRELYSALQYRGPLSTSVNTFMKNWYNTAKESGGSIYTSWNQTRGVGIGARTGRLSSTPNMQNIPVNVSGVNKARPAWCPELPLVRKYIKAPDGYVLLGRDYSAQEVRVFAHFEMGELYEMYHRNPSADVHQFIADMVCESGTPIVRRQAKTILFLTFYGGGVNELANKLGTTYDEAKTLKAAFLKVFPGLKEINREMKSRAAHGKPLRTLGGRLYLVEPSKVVNGKLRTFDYKMLNLLIQGSSADMTKEAMVRYHASKVHSRLLLNVHDELIIMSPIEHARDEMKILQTAMESIALDVPILSGGEIGPIWQEMTEYVDV
jgi:DNA polymerase-1